MGNQFLAVVPEGLKDNKELAQLLGKLKRTMRERDQEVRFTPPDLWHVTLYFLGEVPAEETRLVKLLEEWSPPPVTLRLQGLGAFPAPDQARVLRVGVQASQELLDLQADLGARLKGLGFPPDERGYAPHLTLARSRNLVSVTDLVKLGGRKHFGDYKIREVILFESVLQGNIIKYVPRWRKAL
ncbi:MAG: RNA 2',3'-cyclic phosphodiesterase [Bdellovibrionales bacterium]|nr:RNA 2',3'-cyclic phosphodiesterase [Bdellovibrionales bacterium]